MLDFYKEYIEPENEKLGEMLGIKRITVKDVSKPYQVKYVRAINPWGEKVYLTESEMRKCHELGLSMRRV